MATQLCPAQQRVFDSLLHDLPIGNNFAVCTGRGMGKTTMLREFHATVGDELLTMKEFMAVLRTQHPVALEETFERMFLEALTAHGCVIVDDLHLLTQVLCECHCYPRLGFLNAPLTALTTYAVEAGKKLIFGYGAGDLPAVLRARSYAFALKEFQVEDYAFLCHAYLDPATAGGLDYDKIYRFAPRLTAHQLKGACRWLAREENLSTTRFVDYLRAQRMASNVDLGEVQPVSLHDLRGVDEVIRSLEANIILPLENDALATELQLRPKRGVLLAGPPGTGKTTVGRALAHRLKSKFFLVDGTFISGTREFYQAVHHVFESAKQNAPSIIFIDDSDAIFESGEELGLYRYLLTMLDGLESASAGRVCVMMTAMDVSHLPPALIRSGRIELWLEMRLPDALARAAILEQNLAFLPTALREAVDRAEVVAATEGFTGADLKRLVEDGKNLFAYDKVQGGALRPLTAYLLSAIESVRANKERYAEAEARARRQRPSRPVYYD